MELPGEVEPTPLAPVIRSQPPRSFVLAGDPSSRFSSFPGDRVRAPPGRKLPGVTRPNKRALAKTAAPQAQSLFFSRLPAEIRTMIYVEMWRTAGSLRHHIVDSPQAQRSYQSLRTLCVTGGSTEDIRYTRFRETRGRERERWWDRLRSEWALHWICQEAATRRRRSWTPFLPVLLTSRRMYLEAHPTIFSDVTFIFTELSVAAQFLSLRRWHGMAFQSIEICARMPHPSPELYRPDKDRSGPVAGRPDRSRLSSKSNAWERLCSVLAGMGEIRELRIWLDRHGLPNWHVNLSEWRFCDRLRDVRAKVFVLGLPDVPEDREEAACDYLEGAILDELPFVVERAPRIDNWRANLESMVGFG